LAWVAERFPEHLEFGGDLAIVDCLIQKLRESDLFVCILADSRRGQNQTGTSIHLNEMATRVSFFEIELYAAAMYRKPVFVYALEGFDPGPRLTWLLELLSRAFPNWQRPILLKPDDILVNLRHVLTSHAKSAFQPPEKSLSSLVRSLYQAREHSLSHPTPLLLFDGASEIGALPDRDQIGELIYEYRRTKNFQQKATRLWLALRTLMTASYQVADVQQDGRLKEFLPLWDAILADWAGVASWQGWHGHLYAGTIAPLNSQVIVRSQSFPKDSEFTPEIILPPDGSLASAYYNIAKVTGGIFGFRALRRATQYINRAIETRGGPTDNLLAIRGSIRLRSLNWFGAVADFQQMRKIREGNGSSPQKLADVYMHLGQAYAFLPFSRRAEDLLKKAVAVLEAFPDDPNLPRARRKLVELYDRIGNDIAAEDCRQKLIEEARRQGTDDQLPFRTPL
jgi:tetratricopeptide (TPR) repeat protein